MKLKNNQSGLAQVAVVALVVLVLGVIGFVGWKVLKNRSDGKTANTTTKTSQPTKQEEANTAKKVTEKPDNTIHKVDITMQTASDIDRLPSYTPDSFKSYMLAILKNNKYSYNSVDDVDTIAQYSVSEISRVNISGGQAPVDKNGEGHAGGAPIIWVLTPTGTWDEETLNGPVCKSKNGGLIYEEFAKECQDGDSWVKNPNGSITSVK